MKVYRQPTSRRHDRTLAVEAGLVVCPRRGPIDIELCWVCPAYDGLSAGRLEGVVCRWSSTPDLVGPRSVVA